MQTFLPYPDFAASTAVLDDVRLGKQGVEAYQIVRTLLEIASGWRHHPAVRMWRGHTDALPPWLGTESLHASHRSNLLRKDPDWYGRFGWTEPPDLPYIWPVST